MFIGDMFNEDNFHAGDNAWSSEHDQWAKESINENEMQIGDEVLVTYRNEFQGKRGEIVGFGRNKAFVVIEIDGKQYSMHSSDVEVLSSDYDDNDRGLFGDDERDELDEYKGAHDKITFEVDSEKAYNHIMQKYGNVVDWDGDYMTVPARYWPAVQELAFAAGGDVQEIELNEGAEFGAYYYEELAKKVFNKYPDLSTKGRADELLDAGWKIAAQDLGVKRANWEFNYDEDFPSDFVSAYGYLQRGEIDVAEDLGTMAAAAGLGGAAAYGIGQLAGKMINKFDKKYDGVDRTTARKHKDSCACEKCRGSSDTRLKKGVAESAICPVCGCTPCNCTHIIKEGASMQEVFNAITYRIERQMPELFTDYGVEVVANAIKDVAEFYQGAEELGSSDVGAMVRQVVRQLKQQELRKALDEVKKMSTQQKFEKHLKKHGYDLDASQKYWDQKIKDIDAQIAAWDAEMAARKKNKGVAEGSDILKAGSLVKVPHKGKMVPGKIVRYDSGKGGYSPAYVVDIGEYESKIVPVYDVKQGVAEEIDTGEYDARKTTTTGDNSQFWNRQSKLRKARNKAAKILGYEDMWAMPEETAEWKDLVNKLMSREQGVAEGEYDDPRWEPREPDMSRKVDWDIEAERNAPEEESKPTTVTIRDYDGNVVLTFPSTGGYYGDKKYAASKGFDTDSGDYRMSWKRVAESGQGDDSTSPVGGNVHEGYWARLQQERYLKEHKKAFSMLNELNEVFKDK